jgi:hypothetical protein
MTGFRSLSFVPILVLFLAGAVPAEAADVVFPTGSRIGIAPPPGLAASRSFIGFEDATNQVAITMVALPAEAYAELQRSSLAEQGITIEQREDLSVAAGKAFLVTARQKVENVILHKWILAAATPDLTAIVTAEVPDGAQQAYPEAAIRTALASVAVRDTVPVDEQLSLLPFKMGELSGFRIAGVMAGRAVMLTDVSPDPAGQADAPRLVIALGPGGPAAASERDHFARDAFASVPNLAEVRIVSSEPLRIGGQQGHQIMARGKDARTGTDYTIVQWLRFGGGAYMQLVGTAPTVAWTGAYARFRQVRDGIDVP